MKRKVYSLTLLAIVLVGLVLTIFNVINWFEQFKKDFGFTSNYQISKKTGITASSLTRLNNSDDWKNVKIGTMILLALSVDKTLDQLVSHLYKNDKKRDSEK